MSDRLTVLTSKSVFTGTGDLPFEGFVAVRGNRIEAVGTKCEVASYLTQADEVVDLGDRTVMPGIPSIQVGRCGRWGLICPASPMPKRLCRSCVHGKKIIRIARRLLATTYPKRWHRMPRTQIRQLCLTIVLETSPSSALHRERRPAFSTLPPVRDTVLRPRRAMPRRSGA